MADLIAKFPRPWPDAGRDGRRDPDRGADGPDLGLDALSRPRRGAVERRWKRRMAVEPAPSAARMQEGRGRAHRVEAGLTKPS